MQYENKESLVDAINNYSNHFLLIPNDFEIRYEYLLDGISKSSFIKAFQEYRNLIASIYKDMADNPNEYNFISEDKKGKFKNTQQPIPCIIWLMYTLGKAGDVNNRTLTVSAKKLNDIFAGKHKCDITGVNNSIINRNKLFLKLTDLGFAFSISDFDNINNDFTVKININPDISVAIKAFTLSRYSDDSFNCDFAGFNYHVFSVGFTDRLPYAKLYVANRASEKTKTYVETIIAELANLGFKCISIRHHGFGKIQWRYKCCLFYQYNNDSEYYQYNDDIVMDIPPHYIPQNMRDSYFNYLALMPEKYRSRKRCTGCRKGCGSRVIEVNNGEKTTYCTPNLHLHNLNQIEDIPHIIELIKAMFQPKNITEV